MERRSGISELIDDDGNWIGPAHSPEAMRRAERLYREGLREQERKRGSDIRWGNNDNHRQFKADIQQKLFYQAGYLSLNELPRAARDEIDTPVDALSIRRDFISLAGGIPPARNKVNEIITRSNSSSDFPSFENDTLTKFVIMGAAASPETWPRISKYVPLPNFQLADFLMGVSAAAPGEVKENAEIPYSPLFDDGRQSDQIRSFLARITISRQMQANGDFISAGRMGYEIGAAIWRGIGNEVYSKLTSNPNLSDGVPLFDSTRGNLDSSGAAPSVSELDSAFSLMGAQKNAAGEFLNLKPKFVIGGPGYTSTLSVLRAAMNAGATDGESDGSIITLIDSRLSGSTAWFTSADPIYGGICIAVLAGTEGKPRVERLTKSPAGAPDGTHYRVGYDYVVVPGNYRALTYNAGA